MLIITKNPSFLDFERQAYRYGVPFNTPHHHPQKTLHAMRILAGIDDQEIRITLSKAFYKVSNFTRHIIY